MKSHVTVIPADNLIIVDGQGLRLAFEAPAALHALQWHNGAGHLEFTDGTPNQPLAEDGYVTTAAPYVAAWEAEQARLEEEKNKPPTLERQQELFTLAIQEHLDAFARTRNYDGILSVASYAASTVPKFQAEGRYAVQARDLTWAKGYEILEAVLSGKRPMPTVEAVIAELPKLEWPEAGA